MKRRFETALSALVCLFVFATGVASAQTPGEGADSPEAAYAMLQRYAAERDTRGFAKLVVPGLRGQFMLLLWHFEGKLGFGSDDPAAVASAYQAIAERHGFGADLERYKRLYQETEEDARAIVSDMRERLTSSPQVTAFIADTLAHIDDTMRAQKFISTFLGHVDDTPASAMEMIEDNKAKITVGGRGLWFYRPEGERWFFWASEMPFL